MSLTTLAGSFRKQAAASKGYITIDSKVLSDEGFKPQDGLDVLLTQSFCLADGASLQINTSGQTIPDPAGNVLTIAGTLSISKISITEEMTSVALVLTADGTNISFTIAAQLTGWTFATSFPFMVGYPFDKMPYSNPALVFSTADNSSVNWTNGTIAIKEGQNFASTLGLNSYLKPVVSFLTSWDAGATIPFAGPIGIDKVDNETILYPDADWRATINAQMQPLAFLTIGNPFIRLVIETITGKDTESEAGEETEESGTTDTPQTEQAPQLFFGMSLKAGNDIQVDFSTIWLKDNNSLTIATTSPPGKPLSAMNLINLMAGQNYLGLIPPTMQQFLQVFAFKTFTVSLALDTKKISRVGATIGSIGEWQLFSDFTIKQFDFVWTVMEPSRLASSLYYFESEFEFFPAIFKAPDGSPGKFHIKINNQLQFTGSYKGTVSLNDLVSGITKGAISIPTNIASVKFSDFAVSMDVPAKTYSLSANTEIELNIITNIALTDTTFTINSSTPATGKGDPKFSANITGTFILAGLYLAVNVDYTKEGKDTLWSLDAEMLPGESINLGNLMAQMFKKINLPTSFLPTNLIISQFSVNAQIPGTGGSSYEVKTGIDWKFTFPIIEQKVAINANLWLKYEADSGSYSGGVVGSIKLDYFNAVVDIGYNFSDNDQQLMIKWEGFVAKYDVADKVRTITFSIENWSLGGLITSFMKMLFNPTFELSAPWDILNSISLDGFSVTYNLDTKEVKVNYTLQRSIDLVFITINGLSLTKNAKGVFLSIDGSSVVPAINNSNLFQPGKDANSGDGKSGQDVTKMPDVPGQGTEYFDLRLLAMGQHVELVNASQYNSIKEVTDAMQKAFTEPTDGTIPVGPGSGTSSLLAFNEDSNWLIATNFGILNAGTKDKPVWTVDMQVLFNDPSLYGLRIALNGDKAKVLKGLEFEIMYKKISDSIGVYQIDLTLPDALRNLQFGSVNVTLPSISLEIFTNGDFMVDIGFPYNMDFSRSFTVQAIVPPGIPAMGSGGFYFGKLSSATTNKVPATTYGNFNPVIVFGIGLQVGVGYSVSYGILKAGFSITFFGVIEGVIATYHPYVGSMDQSNPAVVETSYYYYLQGTLGIIGKLYGSIDFGIISASVNITLMVYAQATFEAYNKIPLAIVASVDVRVSASLDLGLFSITIHFSFTATIRQDLTIGTDNTANAPWNKKLSVSAPTPHLMAASAPLMRAMGAASAPLFLSMLADPTADQPTINVYFVPHLTVGGPENGDLAAQQAQYVATLFTDAPDPSKDSTGATSFECLCRDFFNWLILNYTDRTGNNATRKAVQSKGVSKDDLAHIVELLSDKSNPFPIPTAQLLAFLKSSFKAVNVQQLPGDLASAAIFPMFFDLQLNVPAIPWNIDFSQYNMANADYLRNVKEWFAQLAVQVQQEAQQPMRLSFAETSYSISTFVFEDYYVLLGKQLAGYASDAMSNFTYNLAKNTNSLAGMVSWANGISVGGNSNNISVQNVATANQSHPLNGGIVISVTGQMHQLIANDTFTSVVARYAIAPATLLAQNAGTPGLLAVQTIKFGGNSYNVQLADTLNTVAAGLKTTVQALSADAGFLLTTQMQAGSWLVVGAATYTARNSDTFASVATTVYNNLDVQALLMQNQVMPGLFIPGNTFTYNGTAYIIVSGDTLVSMAANISKGGTATTPQQLAASAVVQGLSIQPLGQMLIQPFNHTTVAFTDPANADTLGKLATNYATTVAALSSNYANQQLGNLFYSGKGYTTANVPGLTYLDVASIQQYFADNNSFGNLSGMVSRYQLHGMRLPTTLPGLTLAPNAPCYSSSDCALYALTGQQFPLPAKVAAGFSIQLINKSLDWLQFNGKPMDPQKGSVLEIKLIDNDITQIGKLLTYVQKSGVVPKVNLLEPMKPYTLAPVHYTFQTMTRWQTSGTLNLPYGSLGNQSDATPLIWEFPLGLSRQLALPRQAGSKFSIQIGQYNAAKGLMDYNPSSYYGWSTMVKIDIKRRAGSPVSAVNAYTYELLGADEAGATVLQDLLLALNPTASNNNQDKIIDIQWLYEGGAGLLSVGMNNMKSFIVQANLSTETNPSKHLMLAMAPQKASEPPATGILNSTYDFVRLLWECSITRSGGYYLLYNETEANAGFPDSVFGRGDTATVRLLVTYSNQYNNKPTSYMNCAVTADKIDASACVVYAQSEQQKGLVTTVQLQANTLASLASGFNILLSEMASLNAGIALNASVTPVPSITLSGLVYQVGRPASPNDLKSIAKYYNVTTDALQLANPGIDFGNLSSWQLVRIPVVNYTVSTAAGGPGNMLASIAAYYFIDMSVLAWAVKDVANLFTVSTKLTVNDQILHKVSNIPQGTAGFELKRTDPGTPPKVTDPGYADTYLNNMYNLLSYQVVENAWFSVSRVALPVGPAKHKNQDQLLDKGGAQADDDKWKYHQVVPIAQFAKPNGQMNYPSGYPQEEGNPYRGIGHWVQVHLDWVDYYGNQTITPFSKPGLDAATPLNNPPIPIGYTDDLRGFGKWPSLELSYIFDLDSSKNPELSLLFNFNEQRYIDIPNASPQQDWKQNAANDLIIYTTIYYQLIQLDPVSGNNTMSITLRSSLTGKDMVLSGTQLGQLLQFVKDAYTYLSARSQGNQGTVPVIQPISISVKPGDINPTSILLLTVDVEFKRDLAFVNQDFRDSGMVTRANTQVKPKTQQTVAGGDQHSLSDFATKFEAAFINQGNYVLKIATGTNSAMAASSSNNQAVFVVRMGLQPGNGIYWTLTQSGVYQLTSNSIAQLKAANVPDSVTGALTPLLNKYYPSRDAFDTDLQKVLSSADFDQYRVAIYTYSLQNPVFYAPKPLANSLISKTDVPICQYVTGKGLDCSGGNKKSFTGIDMDTWGAQSLDTIDVFLSSEFSVPAFLVDNLKADEEKAWLQAQNIDASTYVEAITKAKRSLAKTISGELSPILTAPYVSDPAGMTNAQQQLEQQLLSQLGNAFKINALVQLAVTAQSDFVGSGNNNTPPRLYGVPLMNNADARKNEYSISTAKVQLNGQNSGSNSSYLTFAFSTPHAKQFTSIPLDMSYVVTHIEFEISDVPGIEGYQGSNWLTFIIPADISSKQLTAQGVLKQNLGQMNVPIVLRNYPVPPTLTIQEGDAVDVSGDNTKTRLQKASQWDYLYTYTQDHAAQDKIFSDIEFNIIPNKFGANFRSTTRDLFSDMAQIVAVWPQLLQDFNKYLSAITAQSTSSDVNLENAYYALQTLVTLANNLSIAWSEFTSGPVQNLSNNGKKRVYDFIIRQVNDIDNGNILRAIIVPQDSIAAQELNLFRNGQEVDSVTLPDVPYISIDGYNTVPAKDSKGVVVPNEYWFQTSGQNPTYLAWLQSFNIPARTVNVNELNVLQYQYAWASLSIIRNEDLVPLNPTVNTFIYRTPLVRFANKLIPLLNSDATIDIAKLTNEQGVNLALAQHLVNFFSVFFTYDELKSQQVKLTASWNYTLSTAANGPLPAIELPVLLFTPSDFNIPGDYTLPSSGCSSSPGIADPFVCRLAGALKTWYSQVMPVTNNAWFQFDISVFSTSADSQLPLIQLQDVILYFQNITDMS